ncbi:PTS sugar transporter subunit IIA [Adhaeretor mobilis]|uniref:PTS system fructose-specific EIIABC component n=1 Tax=Adhaeretor mobilis TaxID=1930276 RepID=A0A517MR49_9BACT|nr:PTS sugar transporter subunit IIA [Adhaeretor mobilis]QDS97362.1 PTS system fructose-specific EIIABC component [Adhaeretor mobilis]
MDILQQAFSKDAFLLDIEAFDVEQVLRKTIDGLIAKGLLSQEVRETVFEALLHREIQSSTAIGHAVAVPHCYLDCLTEPLIVFVRLSHALNLDAPDGVPTRYFFVLLGPKEATAEHLDMLAMIARATSDGEFRYDLRRARNQNDLLEAVSWFTQRRTLVASPAGPAPDALTHSGQFLGGIRQDIARRLPHYLSDFTDGFNAKTVSSVVFLFFACLAPAVTFGGLMGAATGNDIGVVEMLLGTAICGTIYAFIAGQPLIILGGIGALYLFTAILYQLCADMGLPFLPTYAWVGFWTSFFLILLAVTEASVLMRYFSRFTDELFAALMSVLYIYEAVKAIVATFNDSFAAEEDNHDAAFLGLILAIGTFYIATNLSRFRSSRYLAPWMREFLADFGPTIALATMTIIAFSIIHEVKPEMLQAPEEFTGTTSGRPLLVDPFVGPKWSWFAAAVPALLATLLIVLSHNITGRLMNSPDNHLQKGAAYHLDLAVVGLLVGICSLFGWPWLVAATVRSLAHVRSLATFEGSVSPSGERNERVIHVQETRMTGLIVHLLIGTSLALLAWLEYVPVAVLYGIFLFMGVVSLNGNQFIERLSLLFVEPSLYPRTHYLRQAPVRVIHKFTGIQIVCFLVLITISLAPFPTLQLLFPLFIALLVPLRLYFGRFFQPGHLAALDADETPGEEDMHWSG